MEFLFQNTIHLLKSNYFHLHFLISINTYCVFWCCKLFSIFLLYKLEIDKESLTLPYELSLTNFKMDKDPGTNNPASYESFVQLFSKDGATDHHIYMNNPLKFDGLTFYQASYFEVGPEQYGSVLSVNLDPGRPVKYFGSLLLVLGSMWHFLIRRKNYLDFQH